MVTIASRHLDVLDRPIDSTHQDHLRERDVQTILVRDVASRFKRITGQNIVITPAWTTLEERKSAVREWANHPNCRPNRKRRACIRCRLGHLRSISLSSPQPIRHRCPFGRICAVTPLLIDGHCEAHCKLSLAGDTSDASIERYLELLDILAENVNAHLAHSVVVRKDGAPVPDVGSGTPPSESDADDDNWPEPVHHAMNLIDAHFSDPDLTVSTVARRMGLNRDYLSHLFRMQTGQRMSRRIFLRRMHHAKSLLRTTALQVRQVALASGFLNTDWFSHTFHQLEGLTPSQYRRRSHQVAT